MYPDIAKSPLSRGVGSAEAKKKKKKNHGSPISKQKQPGKVSSLMEEITDTEVEKGNYRKDTDGGEDYITVSMYLMPWMVYLEKW